MDFTTSAAGVPAIGSSIPHKHPVTSMAYHSDGKHLFVATEKDSKVTLVDAINTGKPLAPTAGAGSQRQGQPFRCDREGVSCLSAT